MNKILAVIIGLSFIASLGVLTNVIDLDVMGIGVFNCPVGPLSYLFNGLGYMITTSTTCESNEPIVISSTSPDELETDSSEESEGCSIGFWKNHSELGLYNEYAWPAGYVPEGKFSDPHYFNTMITISSGEDPTLLEALSAKGGGINKLARQSVAALLNAVHPNIDYPLSVSDIIQMTQQAIASEEYSVADQFDEYNNLHGMILCGDNETVDQETDQTVDHKNDKDKTSKKIGGNGN